MADRRSYRHLGETAVPHTQEGTEKAEVEEELNKVVGESHEVILTANTIFPFTMFPDTITIDRTKFNITHRIFFRVAEVISIRIEDILNVTSSVDLFFGAIQIHTKFFDPAKPYEVKFLKRGDALRIDRIMQGYSIAIREKIDLSVLSTEELAKKLDELGQGGPSGQV
jgi:hypothetical protein